MANGKLERLKAQGARAAKLRGHRLGAWQDVRAGGIAHAACEVCGALVVADSKPAPNGIDLAGRALAVGCDPQERG